MNENNFSFMFILLQLEVMNENNFSLLPIEGE